MIKKLEKNYQTSCWDQFHSSQVLEPFICRICLISIIDQQYKFQSGAWYAEVVDRAVIRKLEKLKHYRILKI